VTVRVGSVAAPFEVEYRADGEGGLALLACNGIGLSTFFWRPLAEHFAAAGCTFVTWDYPGHGRSPVPEQLEDLSVAACARAALSVLDALGIQKAVLIGHSMGAQVILEAFRQDRRRALALVPMLGASGKLLEGLPLSRLFPLLLRLGGSNPKGAEALLRTALRMPGLWQLMRALRVVHPDLTPRESFEPWFEHFRNLDLRVWFALARDLLTQDASDLLPTIDVPVLVVGGEHDLFAPVARSREMSARIPGAELLVLREGSHAAMVEQPELVALRLEKFLRSHGLY
jgi:pimeloyl-ACP methyl ester carboxylesterase